MDECSRRERVQPQLIALAKHQQEHRVNRYVQHLHGAREVNGVEQVERVRFPETHHAVRRTCGRITALLGRVFQGNV